MDNSFLSLLVALIIGGGQSERQTENVEGIRAFLTI
jgi:hypothetical protein